MGSALSQQCLPFRGRCAFVSIIVFYLMREYTAKEEGYVFMYVSNENATLVDVYFSLSRPCGNDVVMPHTKSNVIQYNE